jgi:hypothetical protein
VTINEANKLLSEKSKDLNALLDCLIHLSEDKGYLIGRKANHLEGTIEDINSLVKRLRNEILSLNNYSH